MPLLTAKGLSCRRNGELLFTGLSFEIFPGQVIWLRGQNGRGKTSLLRLLVGLSAPEEGRLTWSSPAVRNVSQPSGSLLYIGHANGLKDDLTVTESLAFLARLHGRDDSPDVLLGALRKMGLQERAHAAVRTLSQGQRRRVALARLFLEHDPLLWVLDEPFDALDSGGIDSVSSLMQEHVARRGSVLLTSHLPLALGPASIIPLDLHQGAAA